MRASWYERKGVAHEVFQCGELPVPDIGSDEVQVRVHASGINPSDTKVRSGWDGNTQMPFPRIIPHQDGAGVIEAVGAGVPSYRIGERVWVYEANWQRPFGTAAEYVVLPSQNAIRLPADTDFTTGACLGVPAMTAHRCLFSDGPIKGQTILVTGGAGAVGSSAIQLAKWGGATVITTVGTTAQGAIAREAGADYIVNYKSDDVAGRIQEITSTQGQSGIDRVVDVNFGANITLAMAVLKTNGVLATYATGGDAGAQVEFGFYPALLKCLTFHFVRVYIMSQAAHQDAIAAITACLEAGALRPHIARHFPLEDIADAHEAVDSKQYIGRVIVDVG